MSRALFIALLTLLLPVPAFADTWSDALHAELETGRLDEALELYDQVERTLPAQAEQAAFRKLVVLARLGSQPALIKHAQRFRQRYPDSKLSARVHEIGQDPKAFLDAQKQEPKVTEVLQTKRVTLNFPDTPLAEAVAFLQDISGLNLVLLPEVAPEGAISLRLRDVSLQSALELMLLAQGLESTETCQSVVIGKGPERVVPVGFARQEVAKYPAAYLALKQNRLTVNFDGTPLEDVLDFLRDLSGLNFYLAKNVDRAAPVTLRLRDVTMESALALVCAQSGATYGFRREAVEIKSAKDMN